ncbi:MAG: hypothetical protein J6X53_00450 [Abditibacteriota bacterium]|nr:hypothetical protein [Abditibacteriota bacterium]
METGEINPNEIPWDISDSIGEINQAKLLCPGVYYVFLYAPYEGETEFYLVDKRTDTISNAAKSYGHQVESEPFCLLYPCGTEIKGRKIIDYEIQRYFLKHHLPDADIQELRNTAAEGMEFCPEYFGGLHPPVETPFGQITRYKALMNGVFWTETDTLTEIITIAYPCWLDVFSSYVMQFAVPVGGDGQMETEAAFKYLCFPKKAFPVVLFELQWHYVKFRDTPYIDKAALMNAIYLDFLDYAVSYNSMEQSGMNDLLGLMLNAIGVETELKGSVENMIRLTQDAGVDFLRID